MGLFPILRRIAYRDLALQVLAQSHGDLSKSKQWTHNACFQANTLSHQRILSGTELQRHIFTSYHQYAKHDEYWNAILRLMDSSGKSHKVLS